MVKHPMERDQNQQVDDIDKINTSHRLMNMRREVPTRHTTPSVAGHEAQALAESVAWVACLQQWWHGGDMPGGPRLEATSTLTRQ